MRRRGPRAPNRLQVVVGVSFDDSGDKSVIVFKREIGTPNGTGQLRLLAHLNREASSTGTFIPSESLNPTARLLGSSMVYITLIDRPLS
jgi:hypothetical protein